MKAFPGMLKDILQESASNMKATKIEWERLAAQYYSTRGRPVPDWAQYIEIQEGLGLIENTDYHRNVRRLKKRGQELLKIVFDVIGSTFPNSKWVQKKQCYLTAAVSSRYTLPIWGNGPCS